MDEMANVKKGMPKWLIILALVILNVIMLTVNHFSPLDKEFSYEITGYSYVEGADQGTVFQGSVWGKSVQYYFGSGHDILAYNLNFDGKRIGFGNSLDKGCEYLCTSVDNFVGDAGKCGWGIGNMDQSVMAFEVELQGQKQLLLLSSTGLSEEEIRQHLEEVFQEYPEWKNRFTLL